MNLLTYISIIVTVLGIAFTVFQFYSDKNKAKLKKIENAKFDKENELLSILNISSIKYSASIIKKIVLKLITASTNSFTVKDLDSSIIIDTVSDDLFLPSGVYYIIFGEKNNIIQNAEQSYSHALENLYGFDKSQTTFIFVTPYSWSKKDEWISNKEREGKWKNINVFDAEILSKWVDKYPIVSIWLDIKYTDKFQNKGIILADDFWDRWSTGSSLKLNTELLIDSRKKEVEELLMTLSNPSIVAVKDASREESLAFIIASLKNNSLKEKDYFERCFIVEKSEALKILIEINKPLIILPLFEDDGSFNYGVSKGHTIIVPLGADSSENWANKITLPTIGHDSFINSLKIIGISQDNAEKYSKESARNITILRRQLKFNSNLPEWAKPINAIEIIPVLLIGRWDENIKNDKIILSKIARKSYEDYSVTLNKWLHTSDSPFIKIGSLIRLASPLDAWTNVSMNLNQSDFEQLRTLFFEILREINPALELAPLNRPMAQMYGKTRQYSHSIREGIIQSLILISIYGNQLKFNLPTTSEIWVDNIIDEFLNSNDPLFWKSIEQQLPLIAEASPSSFLNAIEKLVSIANSPIIKLFEEEPGFISVQTHHTGLLWALEGLAWLPEYFSRATRLLAKLAVKSPKVSIANSPSNSLTEIFKPWHFQTKATYKDRMEVLESIALEQKEVAWDLLIKMLFTGREIAFSTHQMRWRMFNENTENKIYNTIIWNTVSEVVRILLSILPLFEFSENKVAELIGKSIYLSQQDRRTILTFLETNKDKINQKEYLAGHSIRWILTHYRTDGSLMADEIKQYENLYHLLEPKDDIENKIWMFNEHWPINPDDFIDKLSSEEQQKIIDEKRKDALKDIYNKYGIEKILELIPKVKEKSIFGDILGYILEDESGIINLCTILNKNDKNNLPVFYSFIFRKTWLKEIDWAFDLFEKLKENQFPNSSLYQIFIPLNQSKKLWSFIDSNTNTEIRNDYWVNMQPHFWFSKIVEDKVLGLKYLIEYKRYFSAIYICSHFSEEIPTILIEEILRKAATEKANEQVQWQNYEINKLFETLDKRQDIESSTLINLEWLFLPVLSSYGSIRKPKLLHDELSKSPEFLIDVLKCVYKSDNETITENETKDFNIEEAKNKAIIAYELLNSWKKIPGVDELYNIDETFLNNWIDKVRELAGNCGRLAPAERIIGQILASYPEKKDDIIWPPHEISKIIERINSDDIKISFQSAIFNKRGSFSKSMHEGGERERGLATYFNELTKKLNNKYPNVASIMERLSKGYEADAMREDERAAIDKLEY